MKYIAYILWIVILVYSSFLFFWWLINDSIPSEGSHNIVVYGNTVYPDGELSGRLQARLDHSVDIYEDEGIAIDRIIVSWGVWKEGVDEAVAMKKYLLTEWIDESVIITDSLWYTSSDTSKNALELLGDVSVIWVSQWFHIQRVKLSLKNAWFENVYGSAPAYFEVRDIYSFVRELAAYLKYKKAWS